MNNIPISGVRQVLRNLSLIDFMISQIVASLKATTKIVINLVGLILSMGIFKWGDPTLIGAKNLLVIHSANVGDTLFLTPTLRTIKESFPKIKIYLVLWQRHSPILEYNTHVEKILWMEDFSVHILKENNIDFVINYAGTLRTVLTCIKAGIKNVVGFSQQGIGFLMSREFSKHSNSHLSEMYCRVALLIGADNTGNSMEYFVSKKEKKWADNFFKQHTNKQSALQVIIHPCAGWTAKEWQTSSFKELMGEMSLEFNVSFTIVGSKGELRTIKSLLPENQDNFSASICTAGIREISSLIDQANLFIGNDSGFGHVAEVLDTPSILLYGPTNPTYSSPKNDPRHQVLIGTEPCQPIRAQYCLTDAGKRGCKTFACIRNIPVNLVLERIRPLLQDRLYK